MTKHVEILRKDGNVLRGYLELPENAKEILVMFHGFTGNKTEHNGHFRNIARMLAKKNIASLRMDYFGNGESDGEFYEFTFDTAIEDAYLMLDFAKNVEGIEKVDVLGFSLGGAVAANVVTDENCHKLILMSAAGIMPEIAKKSFESWKKLENGNVYNMGFEMSKAFVDSFEGKDMFKNAESFNNKVLVLQGKDDLSVPYLTAARYAVRFPNSLLHIIYDCGHGYDSLESREKAYNYINEFLERF